MYHVIAGFLNVPVPLATTANFSVQSLLLGMSPVIGTLTWLVVESYQLALCVPLSEQLAVEFPTSVTVYVLSNVNPAGIVSTKLVGYAWLPEPGLFAKVTV